MDYILNRMPPGLTAYLDEHGESHVETIVICRVPLSMYVAAAVRAVSDVDATVYHLFQILYVANVKTRKREIHVVRVDKDEVVKVLQVSRDDWNRLMVELTGKNTRWLQVEDTLDSVNQYVTLNEYFTWAAATAGPNIWRYDAFDSNCQHFIIRCLQGLDENTGVKFMTPEIRNFIEDEASKDVRRNARGWKKLAGAITDVAGIGRTAVDGASRIFGWAKKKVFGGAGGEFAERRKRSRGEDEDVEPGRAPSEPHRLERSIDNPPPYDGLPGSDGLGIPYQDYEPMWLSLEELVDSDKFQAAIVMARKLITSTDEQFNRRLPVFLSLLRGLKKITLRRMKKLADDEGIDDPDMNERFRWYVVMLLWQEFENHGWMHDFERQILEIFEPQYGYNYSDALDEYGNWNVWRDEFMR